LGKPLILLQNHGRLLVSILRINIAAVNQEERRWDRF
jgi:hypothetical protein